MDEVLKLLLLKCGYSEKTLLFSSIINFLFLDSELSILVCCPEYFHSHVVSSNNLSLISLQPILFFCIINFIPQVMYSSVNGHHCLSRFPYFPFRTCRNVVGSVHMLHYPFICCHHLRHVRGLLAPMSLQLASFKI